jgi:hypothetical protein
VGRWRLRKRGRWRLRKRGTEGSSCTCMHTYRRQLIYMHAYIHACRLRKRGSEGSSYALSLSLLGSSYALSLLGSEGAKAAHTCADARKATAVGEQHTQHTQHTEYSCNRQGGGGGEEGKREEGKSKTVGSQALVLTVLIQEGFELKKVNGERSGGSEGGALRPMSQGSMSQGRMRKDLEAGELMRQALEGGARQGVDGVEARQPHPRTKAHPRLPSLPPLPLQPAFSRSQGLSSGRGGGESGLGHAGGGSYVIDGLPTHYPLPTNIYISLCIHVCASITPTLASMPRTLASMPLSHYHTITPHPTT